MIATPPTSRYVTRDSSKLDGVNRQILDGEPIIVGTEIPVRDVVALWQDEVRPEDIPELLYDLVSPAQVFDALSFYLDNKSEIDGYIVRYRELGALSRSAILLSHSPFWDELEASIEQDRQALDVEMEQGQTIA